MTRRLDALAAKRRRLSAGAVDGNYRFTGPDDEHVCEGCAIFVDQLPHLAHLHARDTSLALDSRAA